MYNSYGELCTEVYEISKPVGFSYQDVLYYIERLQQIDKKELLEVACGSGRVLIPLLQKGFKVDGIDYSSAMLDSCRKACKALDFNPVLLERNMSSFNLNQNYEAIIIPGGSIQLIELREDLIHALKCYYAHLKHDGIIIMDILLQTDFTSHSVRTRLWENSKNEVITLEEKRIELDIVNQRTISLLKYEKWKDGALLQTELQRLSMSWYGIYEFQLLLESIGFVDVTISANYDYKSIPENGDSIITYEARKSEDHKRKEFI